MTKEEFSGIVLLIAKLFPQSIGQFTEAVVDAWYEALSDLDYENTHKGIIRYAQDNQWPPTIADIRKYGKPPKVERDVTEEEGYKEFMKRFGDRYREMDKW